MEFTLALEFTFSSQLFLSIAFAFFAALFLVIVKRKKKDYEMPLVPFVLAAYLFSLFENIA